MKVPKKAISELRQIHLEVTGQEISEWEAETIARDLLLLFAAVYKPLPDGYGADRDKVNQTRL